MSATTTQNPSRPLTLVFISPFNLFDTGGGAALSMRTMLEQLSKCGVICHAVTACCFDVAPPESLAKKLQEQGLVKSAQLSGVDIPVWQGSVQGVGYDVVQLATQQRDQMTAAEELVFRDAVRDWLDARRPDLVITFGGFLLDIELQRCARAAGAAVVFYLANQRYGRRETFAQVDLILTNSTATCDYYARSLGLHCHNAGVFVDTAPIVAAQRDPQFVTFINPLPEKGVGLFLKLVQRALRDAPEMRFLVVEGRGALVPAMQRLGFPANILAQTTVVPMQHRMAPIYGQTRILLVPSFCYESSARVVFEANANGIPVLAANRGGIPETMGGAGKLLPIPEQCTKDYWAIPSDDDLAPWWDGLLTLWRANAYYEMYARKARAVAETQILGRKAEQLEAVLQSLVR